MTWKEIIRRLKAAGFIEKRSGKGSHSDARQTRRDREWTRIMLAERGEATTAMTDSSLLRLNFEEVRRRSERVWRAIQQTKRGSHRCDHSVQATTLPLALALGLETLVEQFSLE